MSSSSSQPTDGDATADGIAADAGPPSPSLLVERIAALEREVERLEAETVRLERETERLERCLARRRRERQDVIDRYERQLRRRTAELERGGESTGSERSDADTTGLPGRILASLTSGLRKAIPRLRQ